MRRGLKFVVPVEGLAVLQLVRQYVRVVYQTVIVSLFIDQENL